MKKSLLIILLFVLVVCGCETKTALKKMIGAMVTFPSSLYTIENDQLEKYTIPSDRKKIIVWFDSTGCNQCKALDLYNFDLVYDYCQSSEDIGCDFLAIFSPTKDQLNDLAVFLWQRNIGIPFVLDMENEFHNLNECIHDDDRFHSFLLNEKNEIVLVGRPNYNNKMWSLYKEQLE